MRKRGINTVFAVLLTVALMQMISPSLVNAETDDNTILIQTEDVDELNIQEEYGDGYEFEDEMQSEELQKNVGEPVPVDKTISKPEASDENKSKIDIVMSTLASAQSEMVTYNWPLKISNPEGKITDPTCHKSETNKYKGSWEHMNSCHFGTDFSVGIGTNVYASAKGVVSFSGSDSGYGNYIVIKHPDGKYSLYGHLSSRSVSSGTTVSQGALIGKSGNTGFGGTCLHFGIYKVNPSSFYESNITTVSQLYSKVYDPLQIVKPHVIHFELNGASGSFPDKEAKFGTTYTLPASTPTATGKVFTGWYLKRLKDAKWYVSGEGWKTLDEIEKNNYSRRLYSAKTSLNVDNSWINGCNDYTNYRFDAQFKTATYTVTYNANGGTGAPASQIKTYNKTLNLQKGVPTRTNYTFKGWATNSSATSPQYQPGGSYTSNSNITLYAVWETKIHTHSWGGWRTTKEPTATAAGEVERKCTTCGAVERQTLPPKGSDSNSESEQPASDYSPATSFVKADLPAVKITKPKAGKKSAKVKWKKISKTSQNKIASIQIQYSTDRNFRKGVKTATAKKSATSKKIKKLKSKKKYYVRVRAYKKDGNVTHISKWSKVKKVKVK